MAYETLVQLALDIVIYTHPSEHTHTHTHSRCVPSGRPSLTTTRTVTAPTLPTLLIMVTSNKGLPSSKTTLEVSRKPIIPDPFSSSMIVTVAFWLEKNILGDERVAAELDGQ